MPSICTSTWFAGPVKATVEPYDYPGEERTYSLLIEPLRGDGFPSCHIPGLTLLDLAAIADACRSAFTEAAQSQEAVSKAVDRDYGPDADGGHQWHE